MMVHVCYSQNVDTIVIYWHCMFSPMKILLWIGDLMKSLSLLIYKHEEGAIKERSRDYNANWMNQPEYPGTGAHAE